MEEMLIKGYWWLPSKPEEFIAGVLTYNGNDRSTLELFGCFESFNSHHYRKYDPNACDLILGITQKGVKYSLLNNIRSSFSTSAYEIVTFTTNIILEGIHIQNMKQKCFTGELLSFKYLRNWYRKDMIEIQDNEKNQVFTCRLNDISNGRVVKLGDSSEVVIVPTYRNAFTGRNDEIHLYQSTQLALATPVSFSAWDFLSRAKILQQFVSLIFLSPQYFDEMRLKTEENDYYDIKVYVTNEPSVKPLNWAFLDYDLIKDKLDDIVSKWFEYSEDMYPIQNHLFRALNPNKSIGDENLLIIAQAIDGISSSKLSLLGNLKTKTEKLYNLLGGIKRLQNNKVDADIFYATRNYYAHLSKGGNHNIVAKGEDLLSLIQKSELLLTCAILHLYGLTDSEIDICLGNSTFMGWTFLRMKLPSD